MHWNLIFSSYVSAFDIWQPLFLRKMRPHVKRQWMQWETWPFSAVTLGQWRSLLHIFSVFLMVGFCYSYFFCLSTEITLLIQNQKLFTIFITMTCWLQWFFRGKKLSCPASVFRLLLSFIFFIHLNKKLLEIYIKF